MPAYEKWLVAGAALILLVPLAVWLGHGLGRKAARVAPGMAMALWFLNAFFKVDPPPPPRAERVHKDEEDAGAPPPERR
jgi:hypothetical protein